MPLHELLLSEITIKVFACMEKIGFANASFEWPLRAKPSSKCIQPSSKLKCAFASRWLMANVYAAFEMCIIIQKLFGSSAQDYKTCALLAQITRTSKMILEIQWPLLLLYTKDIFNCSIQSRDCSYLVFLELMLSCSPFTLR